MNEFTSAVRYFLMLQELGQYMTTVETEQLHSILFSKCNLIFFRWLITIQQPFQFVVTVPLYMISRHLRATTWMLLYSFAIFFMIPYILTYIEVVK